MNYQDACYAIIEESEQLRGEMATAKTKASSELVKIEIAKRKRFRVKLRDQKRQLSTLIAELQGWKGTLDIADQYQTTDIEELDDLKWDLIQGRKDATSPHGVSADDQP